LIFIVFNSPITPSIKAHTKPIKLPTRLILYPRYTFPTIVTSPEAPLSKIIHHVINNNPNPQNNPEVRANAFTFIPTERIGT